MMVGSGSHQAESMGSQCQDHFRDLEQKTRREVCILPTPVRGNLEVKVTSLMRRMPETCRRRLITLGEACAMNGESELHPILTSLLRVRRMVAIGADRELPLISLSHMMRTIIMNVETEIHPWWVWEMSP